MARVLNPVERAAEISGVKNSIVAYALPYLVKVSVKISDRGSELFPYTV